MKKKLSKSYILKSNFDYEEDNYDKLINIEKRKGDFFTNRAKMKKRNMTMKKMLMNHRQKRIKIVNSSNYNQLIFDLKYVKINFVVI